MSADVAGELLSRVQLNVEQRGPLVKDVDMYRSSD